MEQNKLIGTIVSMAVVVICCAAILMPVISDATDHTIKFTNAATSDAFIIAAADETVTLSYNSTDGYLVNGVSTTPLSGNYATVTSDNLSIRWASGTPAIVFYGDTWTVTAPDEFDLTVSNGTITGTYTVSDVSTDVSVGYTTLYYQSTDGDYVMNYGGAFYLQKDTEILLTGHNSSLGSGMARWFQVTGSIADGFTLTYNSGETTITEYTLDGELVSSTSDVYLVEGINFVVSDELTLTMNRLVVPAEVTGIAHNADELVGYDAIINAIPVIVIAALMVAAVGVFITSKRD